MIDGSAIGAECDFRDFPRIEPLSAFGVRKVVQAPPQVPEQTGVLLRRCLLLSKAARKACPLHVDVEG
jgi:hypothetical protein